MIATIDMHIRDERVLFWIIKQGDQVRIKQEDVAAQFGCCRNTAAAILHRLCLGGHLERHGVGKRSGYEYKVIPHEAS
ncbi:MAG: hypothetical protein SF123_07540 [Chloroflexota bacterium]|nr:hypothetical protein [Chloroflexota bacterium]